MSRDKQTRKFMENFDKLQPDQQDLVIEFLDDLKVCDEHNLNALVAKFQKTAAERWGVQFSA